MLEKQVGVGAESRVDSLLVLAAIEGGWLLTQFAANQL